MRSMDADLAGLMRLLGTAALSLVLVSSLVVGQAAWSEEAETEEEDEEGAYTEDIYLMEEAIVVGSRHAPRSEKESAAPVDVLNADQLRTQAAVDMDDMLRTLAPSYNIQRHGIDDEATLVRPATLRGLPPDNLLVL
ncbi:MAG: TonB-dependent receptor plug domain-containing protein, partial [Gemmatimonadetes bacterium]|nr:TonB-dependent receptor plug domain-containing protein [Gemmatimonadota bacterium]